MDYIFIKSKRSCKGDFGSVYARVREKGLNRKYSLGLIIRESEWKRFRSLNYARHTVMSSVSIKYGQFATILMLVKSTFELSFVPEKAQQQISQIKAQVLLKSAPEPADAGGMALCQYLDSYIDSLQTGKRLKRGQSRPVSDGYIANLRSLQRGIAQFEQSRHTVLRLNDVTTQFQKEYVKWNIDRGCCQNTISHKLSMLKTVLTVAYEDNLIDCKDFMRSDFVPKQQEVDHIYLTAAQIQQMLQLDLSSKRSVQQLIAESDLPPAKKGRCPRASTCRHIEASRDVFIVGCLTGQRVSDYSRVNSSMISQLNDWLFLRIVQNKTGKKVFVPLDKRVMSILDKYHGTLPHVNYKTMNLHLKYIARLLGWTHQADIEQVFMGPKRHTRFCDLIGTHTARRSFATNAYAAGIPLSSIMAVTGHSTEHVLRRYLRLQEKEKALLAAKDFEKSPVTCPHSVRSPGDDLSPNRFISTRATLAIGAASR